MQNSDKILPLNLYIKEILAQYFKTLDGAPIKDLYHMFLEEIEAPLLEAVMEYTGFNQSKAAGVLGINRVTLRKKLLNYRLL